MYEAKNYLYGFGEVAERAAVVRPLTVTLAPGTQYERQQPSRFRAILDQTSGAELAAVSDQYTLVQNADIVTAVERVGDTLGISLKRADGRYRNGRTRLSWEMPSLTYTPKGTASPIIARFEAGNDYGAGGSIVGNGSFQILICTNGMRRMFWQMTRKLIHKGTIGVPELVEVYGVIMAGIAAESEANAAAVGRLAAARQTEAQVERLLASVRESRRPVLQDLITANVNQHGETAWALAQAVTEASTHHFPATWATDDWSAKQVEALIKDVTPMLIMR